jgi:hypothetical protein
MVGFWFGVSLGLAALPAGDFLPQPTSVDERIVQAERLRAQGKTGTAAELACEDLVLNELYLCFRRVEGDRAPYVTQAELAAWGASTADLRARASSLLTTNPLQLRKIDGGGQYYEVICPPGREAVVLLHPEWLSTVGPVPLVTSPVQGVVLVWDAMDPEVNKIVAVGARKMFEGYPGAISPLVYRWNGSGFVAWGDARPRDPAAPTR